MLEGEVENPHRGRPVLATVFTGDQELADRNVDLSQRLTVGRGGDEPLDLVVADRLLSRHHATIGPIGETKLIELVDNDSRNGSFVEGERVRRRRLDHGDVVRMGVNVFVVDRDDRERLPTVEVGRRDQLVGRSVAFCALDEALDEAGRTGEAVVITGEAGAGKTLAASEIHRRSDRTGSLIAFSCRGAAAPLVPRDLVGSSEGGGFFGAAHDGTLVLEEIDLLPPELQDLLRTTLREGTYRPDGGEERPFTARVVATTSAGLDAAVSAGVFDGELRDRLAQRRIEIPPLRDRRVDVPVLLKHFLALEEPERTFDWSATCLEKLLVYDWPHNVRELRNVSRRMTLVEDDVTTLRSAHLPKEIGRSLGERNRETLTASAIMIQSVPSRDELEGLLQEHAGDATKLADHYGKDRRQIYRWLARHDLHALMFRKRP